MIRICMIACCFFFTFSSLWAKSPRTVLLVNTFHWQFPWQQKITQGFIPEFKNLSAKSNLSVTLFVETLDRFKSKGSQGELLNYLAEKYASHKIDLIIANDFAALDFVDTHLWKALKNPQVLAFPGMPALKGIKNIENLGYITPGKIRFSETLNLMARLHPKTERIVVVTGKSTNSLEFKNIVEIESRQLTPAMEFWTEITYDRLIRDAAALTRGTLIFYLPFLIDKSGHRYIPAEVLKELSRISPVPVYSAWDTFLGEGIVGGRLLSAEITGQILARRTFEILNGRPAGQIRETPEAMHAFLFDQRQLDRFNIKAELLPEGSRIKFQHIGIWDTHKGYILFWISVSALVLLMVLYRSNRNLKASKDKFRSLSDAAFEGVIISKEGKILEANRSMCRMVGYPLEELIGMEIIKLAAPGHRTSVETKITSGSASGQIYEAEGQRKDGTVFPVEVHAREFQYRGKKVRVAAVRNMTEHRQARENLQERERLYKALFKKNISVMLLIDAHTGEIVDANPSACTFYGYTQDQLTRMKITDINILPKEEVLDEMEKARLEKRQYFNFRHCLSSGRILDVEVYSGPVEVWGRSLLCSVIHDVSMKKLAEKEREQLIANLKNALDEIKTLKGIVPICAHCKKIRDDRGYWNLLESYIEKHSDASFSHGICPECSDKLYGDQDWYTKSKKKKRT